MYCKECGTKLPEDARFCGNCGCMVESLSNTIPDAMPAATETPVAGISASDSVSSVANSVTRGRKINKAVIIAGIVVVVVSILAVGFVAIGGVEKTTAMWQLNKANRYLEDMEYEKAIVAFEAVIEIEPREEKAYAGLAKAYVGMEDYESAIKVLKDGIRETGSDMLRDYLEEVQEQWDEEERRIYGSLYAVDMDLDETNNTGISGADIYITDEAGDTIVCQTDDEGNYDSGHLPGGVYIIRFSANGYVEYEEEIKLTGGKYELNVYIEPDARATLYGSVLIADADTDYSNNLLLSDAQVSLKKLNGSNEFRTTAMTDENGQYVIPELLMGVYRLTVSKSGYLPAEQIFTVYEGQNISYNTMIEAIGTDWDGTGTASGTIYDALTGNGVEGLTLKLRRGIGSREGEVLEIFETDSFGHYTTPELESGNYSIEISDERPGEEERYLKTVINIKILGGLNIDNQDGTVSNTIQTGQVRIVLTWGASPYDLDSHLVCNLESGDRYHIYFRDKTFYLNGGRIADLDLDDTNMYGPETTTIYQSEPGEYLFWVHNYSRNNEHELAESGACVQVYMGYSTVPTYVFYVPNETGYGWEVFSYNSVTGELTPSNKMYKDYYSEY